MALFCRSALLPRLSSPRLLSRGLSSRPAVTHANLLFPWLHLEAQVPAAQLRERMSEFTSQAALLYALLGGISAAALISPDASRCVTDKPSATTHHAVTVGHKAITQTCEKQLGKGWAERWAAPLWCASVCFNLQGLMSSMLTLAHANAMPDAGLGALTRAMPISIHATGWLLVPAIASLSGAIVCSTEVMHGAETSVVAAVGVSGLCTASLFQMMFLHAAAFRIRRKLPLLRSPPPVHPWQRRGARGRR